MGPGVSVHPVPADTMSSTALHKRLVNGAKPGLCIFSWDTSCYCCRSPDTQLGGGIFCYLDLDVSLKVSTVFTCATFYCCLIILHFSFVFFTCASGFVCKNRLLVCVLKSILLYHGTILFSKSNTAF